MRRFDITAIQYGLSERVHAINHGGIGMILKLARNTGLVKRCDQKNLIAQLKSGVRSLCAPTDSLLSNGAYMLMTSLAWTLKAWSALLLPVSPRHRLKHKAERTRFLTMEFRNFLDQMNHVPCQITPMHARPLIGF